MINMIYILMILFIIVFFILIMKKRYKKMPFICQFIFFSLFSCCIISVIYIADLIYTIYMLTIAFAIISAILIKRRRYKVMPFTCVIIFLLFFGFCIVSIVSFIFPHDKALLYSDSVIMFGITTILVGINDLYSIIRCKERVDGIYCGCNRYSGGVSIVLWFPEFSYTFNGTHYCEQTTQNLPYKELNEKMTVGNLYPIYINPKHPAVFVLSKKIKLSTTLIIMFGLIILLCGIFYYFINPIL